MIRKRDGESSPNYPTIGIIGCGRIGGRQATNFLASGYSVYVYDINPDSMAQLQSLGAHITFNLWAKRRPEAPARISWQQLPRL